MKFLCLCRYDLATFSQLTPDDFGEIAEICAPHDKAMRESGKIDIIGSLAMPHETRVLRATGSQVASSAGPFQADAQPVGAFFIVEADDLDTAESVARLHPGNHLGEKFGGAIEIIPVGDAWVSSPAA